MKKLFGLVMAMALMAVSVTTSSCGSDKEDDEPVVAPTEIVGTWEYAMSISEDWGQWSYMSFRSGGLYAGVTVERNPVDGEKHETVRGLWTVTGNVVKVQLDNGTTDEAIIKSISSKAMALSLSGFEARFTKVPDSTIDKYL